MTFKTLSTMMVTAAIIAGTLSSCNKNADSATPEGTAVDMKFNILSTAYTKAGASEVKEADIKNTQLFVFRSDGSLDAYKSADSGSEITVSCTTGDKEIFALVNAPAEAAVTSKTELLAKTSSLTDNSTESLVMLGKITAKLEATGSINIPVRRLVARLAIKHIATDFTSAAYRNTPFKVNSIYVINAAGDINYGLDSTPTKWINKMSFCDEDAKELLYQNTNDSAVTSDSPFTEPAYFYVYPNGTEQDSQAEEFGPRFTRIVVETTLGDKKYYYPISIPGIEANKTYNVNSLTITRPGSLSPDVPVTSYECTFSVSVIDWETGTEEEMTI